MKRFVFIPIILLGVVSSLTIGSAWPSEGHADHDHNSQTQETEAPTECCVEPKALPAGETDHFYDVKMQGEEFISYHHAITLNPEQEEVKKKALESMSAPCCKSYSMYTCCCSCNLAKSVWGLSNHLIADQNYNSDQVRAAVTNWIGFINERGYEGDTCQNGRCNSPFNKGGCGGMGPQLVI